MFMLWGWWRLTYRCPLESSVLARSPLGYSAIRERWGAEGESSLSSEPLVVERQRKQGLKALNQVNVLSTFFT